MHFPMFTASMAYTTNLGMNWDEGTKNANLILVWIHLVKRPPERLW
jgi:hypothetical protein